MASEAIKIPCRLWPHPSVNKNATWNFLTGTPTDYALWGVKCPDNLLSDVCFSTAWPIPSDIHGTTPNPKLWVILCTPAAGTSNYKLQLAHQVVTLGTTGVFLTASFAGQTQASAGANILTKLVFSSLSGTFTVDKLVQGVLRRDGTDAADAITDDVFLHQAWFVADTA